MTLFDPNTLQKLEQLALVATKVRVGMMKGERRSRKRGSSIEFADYRDYVRGDDLRRLDWNIMARLEKPFIKLLEDEEDLAVHILVDTSASMDWPTAAAADTNENHKLSYALRTAAALGYIDHRGHFLSPSEIGHGNFVNSGKVFLGVKQAFQRADILSTELNDQVTAQQELAPH